MTLAQKSDRILAQTRGLSGATPNATQLIEELRWALEAYRQENATLTAERDEARRYSCDLEARIIVLEEDRRDTSNKFGTNPCSEIILPDYPLAREPKEIAKQKGWDCFKENTDDR
jgi:hypothetical protein